MKKIIFIVFMALFAINAFAQVTPSKHFFKGGMAYGFKWSDVDSGETMYSQWFDASLFDANNIVAWIVVDGTGAVDSLSLATIEGQYPPLPGDNGVSYVTAFTIDTIATNKATGIQTNLGVPWNLGVWAVNDSVKVTGSQKQTEPPARIFPQWRIKIVAADITVSMYDGIVRLYLYAKQNDLGLDPKEIRGY
jgi:hypothetical protein